MTSVFSMVAMAMPRGLIYNENKIGPKIEPSGRPYFKEDSEEEVYAKFTKNVLSYRDMS